jgi:hypothetical protein
MVHIRTDFFVAGAAMALKARALAESKERPKFSKLDLL